MVEEVHQNALLTNTFPRRVFQTFDEELFQKSGKRYAVAKLKSKFNRLRMKYGAFSHLLEQSGFGWDPDTNTVTALEDVWKRYITLPPTSDEERDLEDDFMRGGVHVSGNTPLPDSPIDDNLIPSNRKRGSDDPFSSRHKKWSKSSSMEKAFEAWTSYSIA
ncbi:hypothetical protein F0562_028043 [Nyssa sinensis]|uniref:Myb/SANT-like domain-containing protein n=1 Tax=Nyssa sinensis TaxID=561372 RepID=A0A5J5BB29_9ASTE|nr:hypothetical protein F0562_028043 [Nyssa sinensis]